jgi:SnoaL-like domain
MNTIIHCRFAASRRFDGAPLAIRFGLIIVLLIGVGCSKPTTVKAPVSSDTSAAASTILEQWRQAYEVRSVEALAKLYDPSDRLVYVHQGKRFTGWPSAAAAITERLAGVTELRLDLRDISVRSVGGATLLNANMTVEMTASATTVKESGVISMVIVDGIITAEHFSFRGM